ncbi:DJ-1/PfpI family protein [Hymenobacter sp. BT730]|uniref:DJ-1/PfpI family protein n=1 Tax=Hymenobacter sp. BT730 TaxID=3063332 RepID=UPI0026DFC3E8|nr:DJ-1/PfpI family protein [Hymenobacter sp. BT730]
MFRIPFLRPLLLGGLGFAIPFALCAASSCQLAETSGTPAPFQAERTNQPISDKIAPYVARFGRSRPVIAVIGENSGTELTDFVIPYGVLAQAGGSELVTVATQPGVLRMRPALTLQPQETIQEFDARYPQGADYVIVPAVVKSDDPTLVHWVAAQGAKGGTIVSICDGALVVANSGLLDGHRATAHWATEGMRKQKYPATQWLTNVRYVADGRVVSSAGISAAMPTALALVEAIFGLERAAAVAQEVGVTEWGTQHNSDRFHPHFGVNLLAFATVLMSNPWFHTAEQVGVPVSAGVDDLVLALTADAYSRTGRSRAYSVAATSEPLRTRHGLTLVPDRVQGGAHQLVWVLPALHVMAWEPLFTQVLAGIEQRYGYQTAYGMALDFEYPGFKK